MNLKKIQQYVPVDIRNWEKTDFAQLLYEICDSVKQYTNDVVEVHQVVKLGKVGKDWKFLIIINITQDLDNLGTAVEAL
ncbi:hypothetical protein CEQ21_01955 [Niallia circulans]|uniref:Uncharacterized protein n=1 Tax=Niallia circulans TaxID=1397 RepID=A0A553SRU9_NIACI|nr:hypothetical protein [Niallia circulans]TRZ39733.1 hypothetical protein CEQ21_01955 [Niallia circulans]